jgi:hypothetical protein
VFFFEGDFAGDVTNFVFGDHESFTQDELDPLAVVFTWSLYS